jgi:AAA15 family ATPase/GTPase
MLLRFRFSNVRSFRTEQELSLVAGPFTDAPESVRHPDAIPEGVLPVAAIYGANASGKTNVLRAIQFLSEAVSSSHREWKPDGPIPREPFLSDEESRQSPSEFELDFLTSGIRYRYGFRVDSALVLEEWLYAYPLGKKQTWFHRKQGKPILFGARMPGENRTIESLTRKNSLFFSAAAQNNHEALLPVYYWITTSPSVIGDRASYRKLTAMLCKLFPDYLAEVARLVSAADLGISGVKAEPVVNKLAVPGTVFDEPTKKPDIHLMHRLGDREAQFSWEQESHGTLAYLSLLGPVVHALKDGIPLCVDELDGSLHPLLSIQLIRLFNDPATNPKGAQLIFNTHDTNLLSSGLLRRDQIWFTEKKDDGSSQLFPLSDFKPRRTENLENGYLQGRYGAIPFVNPDAFLSLFKDGDGKA